VSSALEMRGRLRSVNDKITYAAEVQSTLRQLLTEVSSIPLKLLSIVLTFDTSPLVTVWNSVS
jgi:hypothetical protein